MWIEEDVASIVLDIERVVIIIAKDDDKQA
jgi:hypothetical protein